LGQKRLKLSSEVDECKPLVRGDVAVVALLLAAPGVDVNKANPMGAAIEFGLADVVELLVAAPGCDVNKCDISKSDSGAGSLPLWVAAGKGHADVVAALLAAPGVDVNMVDPVHGSTALWKAVERGGDTRVLELLLAAQGVDVNKVDTIYDVTPLWKAVERGDVPVVELLLAAPGVDVNRGLRGPKRVRSFRDETSATAAATAGR
jgi:ankyrin repeat protein